MAIYFGAVFRGITVVPINPDLAAREIRFIIENSESTTVFYDPVFEAKIAVLEEEMAPAVKFLAFGDVADLPKVDVAGGGGAIAASRAHHSRSNHLHLGNNRQSQRRPPEPYELSG